MIDCAHEHFHAHVEVNRLDDTKRFAADIHVTCADCGMPFRFLGLPGGLHPDKPTTSVDGTEARMPIAPVKEPPKQERLSETIDARGFSVIFTPAGESV